MKKTSNTAKTDKDVFFNSFLATVQKQNQDSLQEINED